MSLFFRDNRKITGKPLPTRLNLFFVVFLTFSPGCTKSTKGIVYSPIQETKATSLTVTNDDAKTQWLLLRAAREAINKYYHIEVKYVRMNGHATQNNEYKQDWVSSFEYPKGSFNQIAITITKYKVVGIKMSWKPVTINNGKIVSNGIEQTSKIQ